MKIDFAIRHLQSK